MIRMFDAITVGNIPKDAQAVAGYVGGRWPTYATLVRDWPKAKHLSIAVASYQDADCLDVEQGDATNETAKRWVKRQLDRGVKKPVIYTSVSNVRALLSSLAQVGVKRSDIKLWTAHYTFHEHLCGPECGFGMPTRADATQWTDRALGRSLDQSICSDSFFGVPPAPKPKPRPKLKPYRVEQVRKDNGVADIINVGKVGLLFAVRRYIAGKYAEIHVTRN